MSSATCAADAFSTTLPAAAATLPLTATAQRVSGEAWLQAAETVLQLAQADWGGEADAFAEFGGDGTLAAAALLGQNVQWGAPPSVPPVSLLDTWPLGGHVASRQNEGPRTECASLDLPPPVVPSTPALAAPVVPPWAFVDANPTPSTPATRHAPALPHSALGGHTPCTPLPRQASQPAGRTVDTLPQRPPAPPPWTAGLSIASGRGVTRASEVDKFRAARAVWRAADVGSDYSDSEQWSREWVAAVGRRWAGHEASRLEPVGYEGTPGTGRDYAPGTGRDYAPGGEAGVPSALFRAAAREATVSASVARGAQLMVATESEGWAAARRREVEESAERRRWEVEEGRREMDKIADWLEEELYDRLEGCATGGEGGGEGAEER